MVSKYVWSAYRLKMSLRGIKDIFACLFLFNDVPKRKYCFAIYVIIANFAAGINIKHRIIWKIEHN